MASQLNLYNKFFQYIMDGTIDLDTNTLKVALVTSSYTPTLVTTFSPMSWQAPLLKWWRLLHPAMDTPKAARR